MNILIMQPKLEESILQLENELKSNANVDMVIFPEGYLNENIEQACQLAKDMSTILVGGYRRMSDHPKDYAVLIGADGHVCIDRQKYTQTQIATIEGLRIGHILCDELLLQGLKKEPNQLLDLIVHPIGVGMYSIEQFNEWIGKAKEVAVNHQVMVIGVSHANGIFKGADQSIPIAYFLNSDGGSVFVAQNDTRTRLVDLTTKKVSILEELTQ